MRSAKPAPSSSARPRPPNSPPPIRGTRPRTRTTASARRAARRAARPPRSAPAWCRPALGTQVVGSILRPASFCGAVGFKPSVGAINRSGSHDHFSQSCQGAIGATLADTWAVLRAIADRAGGDPGYRRARRRREFAKRSKPARARPCSKPAAGAPPAKARARPLRPRRSGSPRPASNSTAAPTIPTSRRRSRPSPTRSR